MTNPIPQDELIELAKEAGFKCTKETRDCTFVFAGNYVINEKLYKFAQLIQQRVQQQERHIGLLVEYDDDSKVELASYAGGAAKNGAWSALTLSFTNKNGIEIQREYTADDVSGQEYEQMKADAERYRWLKNGCDEKSGEATRIAINCYGLEWDEAIDAARSAGKDGE